MAEISTCLWFAHEAEAAARLYTSLLPDSRVDSVNRAPGDYPGGKAGDVLTVEFTLCGARYVGLNGGTAEAYSNAASIMVEVDTQAEVDRLWAALGEGGKELACGWLTDRWGVPWQITPRVMLDAMRGPDHAAAARAFTAMQSMVKFDVAAIERAVAG